MRVVPKLTYSKLPVGPEGLAEVDWGLEDDPVGRNNSNLFFSKQSCVCLKVRMVVMHFSEQASVEDAAMPGWERPHSSHWGWDGSGDSGLPRKGKRGFLSPGLPSGWWVL